jgi:hypothetical protein
VAGGDADGCGLAFLLALSLCALACGVAAFSASRPATPATGLQQPAGAGYVLEGGGRAALADRAWWRVTHAAGFAGGGALFLAGAATRGTVSFLRAALVS